MVVRVAGDVHLRVVVWVGISEEARERVIWFASRSRHKTKVHQTKVRLPCRLVGPNVCA
jgi:hypothetical protein